MKRITKDMVERGGWRYCCVCRQIGPRVKAHWQHEGREYCDTHRPKPTPVTTNTSDKTCGICADKYRGWCAKTGCPHRPERGPSDDQGW